MNQVDSLIASDRGQLSNARRSRPVSQSLSRNEAQATSPDVVDEWARNAVNDYLVTGCRNASSEINCIDLATANDQIMWIDKKSHACRWFVNWPTGSLQTISSRPKSAALAGRLFVSQNVDTPQAR
jgi:hypothetical protein